MKDTYKVDILDKNLKEMAADEYYIPRLRGDMYNAINLDEGAMNLLKDYYSGKKDKTERYKELLNRFIENFNVANTCKETIQKLLYLGFTKSELTEEFNFSTSDVNEAESDMESYED